MRLGFTGTQLGMTPAQSLAVFDEVDALFPDEADHGLCIGADKQFHEMLRGLSPSVSIVGHPPSNQSKMADCDCDRLWLPKPYLERNRDIVDASEQLLAAPQGPEEQRSGTWSTVRYARKRGKPVTIIWPDGSVTRENMPEQMPL